MKTRIIMPLILKSVEAQPYLTKEEETEFAIFWVDTAKASYGKSRKQIKTIVENVVWDKGMLGTDETISNGWY